MIDKRTNPYNINLDIKIEATDEGVIEEFKKDILELKEKWIEEPQNTYTINRIAYDLEYLLTNEKYEHITIKNNELYDIDLWSLEKLLQVYHKEYPDRATDKKEYTNMDVNNMLFDLQIAGVIGGYMSPAVCADIPSHNNKIFTDDLINVQVPIINFSGGLK